jgi:hypothetical protein
VAVGALVASRNRHSCGGIWRYRFPQDVNMLAAVVGGCLGHGVVITDSRVAGIACWLAPGKAHLTAGRRVLQARLGMVLATSLCVGARNLAAGRVALKPWCNPDGWHQGFPEVQYRASEHRLGHAQPRAGSGRAVGGAACTGGLGFARAAGRGPAAAGGSGRPSPRGGGKASCPQLVARPNQPTPHEHYSTNVLGRQ